jgi:DNA-binding transcriptional regulator YiaG
VFHTLLALMAATRHTAPIDMRILRRWATRSVLVVAATLGVWVGVLWFEGRETSGSAALTLLALIVIAVGILALGRHALEPVDRGS